MTRRVPTRPELLGGDQASLKAIPSRVLRTGEASTTDAQRQTQAGFARTNHVVEYANWIQGTPFGVGQFLTQPDGKGGQTQMLALAYGANVIKHTLGRPAQGFVIVDLHGAPTRKLGAFYSNQTQPADGKEVPTPVYWDATTLSEGVSCAAGDYRVIVDAPGVYDFQFSLQADKLTGGKALLYVWCRISGVDVPWSASRLAIQGNDDEQVPAWDFMLNMQAGQSFELMWTTDDLDLELTAYAATAFCPATPSAILTVSGPVGPILTHVDRSRSLDEQSIRLDASIPCSAKIWVW